MNTRSVNKGETLAPGTQIIWNGQKAVVRCDEGCAKTTRIIQFGISKNVETKDILVIEEEPKVAQESKPRASSSQRKHEPEAS